MLCVLWNCEVLQSPAQSLHWSTTHAAVWDVNLRLRGGPTHVGGMWGAHLTTILPKGQHHHYTSNQLLWCRSLHALGHPAHPAKHTCSLQERFTLSPTNLTQKRGINKLLWFLHYSSTKYFSAKVKKPSWLWNTSPTAFPFRYYNHKSRSL